MTPLRNEVDEVDNVSVRGVDRGIVAVTGVQKRASFVVDETSRNEMRIDVDGRGNQ